MQINYWSMAGSLGVRDSESCGFTEEIGTYMRWWESPGDLLLVIEIFVSFRSFRCAPLAKRHKISITREKSPGLSLERMYQKSIQQVLFKVGTFYNSTT
jgi:hypothetical protein